MVCGKIRQFTLKAQWGSRTVTAMKKKWDSKDTFWAGVFVVIGLLMVFGLYVFLHLWKQSTLRELFFRV